jgi:deoxyadenosine/deoxycytidine kinase
MPRIVIDGNIGSGKTTQLGLLEQKGWEVRREPIDKWPLEEFYQDPKRWAFFFHMVILQTLRPIKSDRPIIYERSLLSSRWVFWPVLVKNGFVTPGEHAMYDKYYEHYSWLPDIYIFLSKDRDLAWEHIQKRGQAGDSGITKEYLEELGVEYENLLRSVPCKVFVVNANRTAEEIHSEICMILTENELFVGDPLGSKMQKKGRPGWQVPCTPFTHMCRLS